MRAIVAQHSGNFDPCLTEEGNVGAICRDNLTLCLIGNKECVVVYLKIATVPTAVQLMIENEKRVPGYTTSAVN